MTRTNAADLRRQHVEIIARLTAMQTHLATCVVNLRDAQPGYPTATGGGGAPRLDAAGNPPGLDRYLSQPDPAAQEMRLLVTLTKQMLTCASQLHDIVARWGDGSASPHEGGIAPRRTGSGGDCVVCGTYCSGAHNDRLRAGLCNSCRVHWQRWNVTNNGDRGEWMLERRRALLNVDDVEVA